MPAISTSQAVLCLLPTNAAACRLLMEGKSVLWHMPGRFALYESGAVEGLTEEAANKVILVPQWHHTAKIAST